MTNAMKARRFALRAALFACLVAGVAAARSFSDDLTVAVIDPGNSSLSVHFLWTTFGIGLVVTAVGYRRYAPVPPRGSLLESGVRIVTRFTLAFAVAIAWTVLCLTVFTTFYDVALRVTFPSLLASLLVAAYACVMACVAAFLAVYTSPLRLLRLGLMVMFGGLALAIVAAEDVAWATEAISFLGVGATGIIFNLAFILSGLLLLALVVDKLGDLYALQSRQVFQPVGFTLYHTGMVITCLCMACIGVFPYSGDTLLLHNLSAHAALLLLVLLMLLTHRVLPIYPTIFTRLSLLIAVACIVTALGYFVAGIISFSLMEVLLLALSAVWFLMFYAFTHQYINERDPSLNEMI